ncbi:MAG: hypothetical protein ACYC7E_11680 [Armatimonadota bacterium]
MYRKSFVFTSLLVLLTLSVLPAHSAWWLWPSPHDNTEVLDQQQTQSPTNFGYMGTNKVGQTFTPAVSPLYRMDLMWHNRYDQRPITIKLWRWQTDYATTVAQPALYTDTITLPGPDAQITVTLYPNIAVTPGALYFMEFSNATDDGEWAIFGVDGTTTSTDYYTGGQLRVNGVFRTYMDLWFKTYTSPSGTPTYPSVSTSTGGAWTAPSAPGAAVTATDYYNIAKSYADYFRNDALNGNGAWSHEYALYEAFLYKKSVADGSPNETYADNVVAMFYKSIAYRPNPSPPFLGFTWMEEPGWAYYWIKDSPSVNSAEHADIKALLLAAARNFWSIREGGVMNRSLGGALTYKLVTTLMTPADSGMTTQEQTDWTNYADGIWNGFKAHCDTDEDSYHYNWLGIKFILELAILYGEDTTLWNNHLFKAYVDRFTQAQSPIGFSATFGDGNPIGVEWCTPTWLFDKAATRYNDPKYKWAAYRAFDAHRQYLLSPVTYQWQAIYDELPSLCFAYFDTTSSITTAQPAEQTEELAARQDQDSASVFGSSQGGWGTGQTFIPKATPLVRLDVKVANRGFTDPGTLKLWKWNTDYTTTVAQPPLFQDTVDLSGPQVQKLLSFYPFLEVDVGAKYYMEFNRPTNTFYIYASGDSTDYYPDGKLRINNYERDTWDLWFKTYTLAAKDLAARQDQVDTGIFGSSQNGWGTGQTFIPTETPLAQLDVKVANRGYTDPGTLKLWKWNTDYTTTVAQPPLFQDTVDLSGPQVQKLLSFYPFLNVDVGAKYYMEFNRPTNTFYIYASGDSTDRYPNGKLRINNYERDTWDLWFKTYTFRRTGSTYTTRQEATQRRISQWGTPPQFFDFGDDQVPDKLILRSGQGKDDLFALVNLIAPEYGHGHCETGAVNLLTDNSALLLFEGGAASGDTCSQRKDHSTAFARRYWGGTFGSIPTAATVDRLDDYRKASVAWVSWDDLAGWNFTQQRRFLLVKDRFLIVRDKTAFDGTMKATCGNVWHAFDVASSYDTANKQWFDLYWRVPVGGVGAGWSFKNPEYYALLYMPSRTGYTRQEWKETYTGNQPPPPYIITQRWVGDATSSTVKWHDTVLYPHGSALSPSDAAAQISVLYDDGTAIAYQILWGDETWTVVDNPTGALIYDADVVTDATYMVTRTQSGVADYVLAKNATTVEVTAGSLSYSWATATTVELGGN